jgi:hypothetical protein
MSGLAFGTAGSRDNRGDDFRKAMDGDTTTFFDAAEPNSQYVGIDLGPSVQAAAPVFSPAGGSHPGPVTVTITSATPGATIRFLRDQGGAPGENGARSTRGQSRHSRYGARRRRLHE